MVTEGCPVVLVMGAGVGVAGDGVWAEEGMPMAEVEVEGEAGVELKEEFWAGADGVSTAAAEAAKVVVEVMGAPVAALAIEVGVVEAMEAAGSWGGWAAEKEGAAAWKEGAEEGKAVPHS